MKNFLELGIVGKGGSSCVYRCLSPSTYDLFALKKVEIKTQNDLVAIQNEVDLLRDLIGSPWVCNLIDSVYDVSERLFLISMELGEANLATILSDRSSTTRTNLLYLKSYWCNMLVVSITSVLCCSHT
jgi:serine/threonine protein kinase